MRINNIKNAQTSYVLCIGCNFISMEIPLMYVLKSLSNWIKATIPNLTIVYMYVSPNFFLQFTQNLKYILV